MRRLLILLILFAPALACNLGAAAPAPTPTPAPAPVLNQPTLGLSPIVGPPGTVITVTATGFPNGTRVNFYISTVSKPSTVPVNNLTIGAGGVLSFAFQLPSQTDNTPIPNNTPLVFTLVGESGNPGASAMFLALSQNGQPTVAPISSSGATSGGSIGSANDFFITAPAISSVQSTGSVTVTGSGSSANGAVTVQVQDVNNAVLGSANTTIQAAAGYLGPWEAVVNFQVPANAQTGYIVAFTAEGKQASIPIYFGAGAQGNTQQTAPLYPTIPQQQPTKLFSQ